MKIRICFSKTEEGRYLSHLDLARTMERSLRRMRAPLAFSEGFNPHPKIAFASALAVGTTGRREYLDVELAARVNVGYFGRALEESLPAALAFVAAEEIGEAGKSLSALVNLAVYRIKVSLRPEDREKVAAGVAGVLAARELWRKPKEKAGKKPVPAKEIRGLIRRIEIIGADDADPAPGGGDHPDLPQSGRETLTIEMELKMKADGQLRPHELWGMIGAAGGFEPEPPQSVCRTALLIDRDGVVFSPMEGVAV